MDPKLNDLLHWAVENTNRPQAENQTRVASTAVAPVPSSDPIPLSITYNPHESSQVQAPTVPSKKLDTGVLDAILGRTDAVRMREAMGIFEDPNKPIQERCNAGEELEDLIQDLDNANGQSKYSPHPTSQIFAVQIEFRAEKKNQLSRSVI
ncbi:hsp70 nucleotide exchange factor fes1 [Puccinia graminis f. sp. tritici]|uniref:Hsp70 nucleotide exchange factor fes1 n=1 Tax=Puccinia graminis f. sp. tritici TaxID=56615 RepID=A0A5B0RXZ9_PUCGR|nr:hsp70 nucleotide exchange factor fes1 [Puccinia graminis f. sp. tritici]